MMLQIKELRASKESVANLEKMVSDHEKNTAVVGYSQIGEIIEMRKAKDVLIDALKEQETVAVEKLDALKAKREKEQSENRFSELFEQRSKIRDGITEKIQQIRAMRDEFKQSEDDFYKTDRLIRECKRPTSIMGFSSVTISINSAIFPSCVVRSMVFFSLGKEEDQ